MLDRKYSFHLSVVLAACFEQAMGKAYNELKQGEPAIERLFELTKFSPKVEFLTILPISWTIFHVLLHSSLVF